MKELGRLFFVCFDGCVCVNLCQRARSDCVNRCQTGEMFVVDLCMFSYSVYLCSSPCLSHSVVFSRVG